MFILGKRYVRIWSPESQDRNTTANKIIVFWLFIMAGFQFKKGCEFRGSLL
ncbi:uncharacterized protein METZ01_LOCUS401420 [marine metagenome]|uniref:Uncharacterized protein n=1 Tax=marine metagenome TaxID=408172 RepID=A0A382VPQ7_9ZZZZ